MTNNINAADNELPTVDELTEQELDSVSGGPAFMKLEGIKGESRIATDTSLDDIDLGIKPSR